MSIQNTKKCKHCKDCFKKPDNSCCVNASGHCLDFVSIHTIKGYIKSYLPGQLFQDDKKNIFVLVDDIFGDRDLLMDLFNGKVKRYSSWNIKEIKTIFPNEIMW